ncbi:hypothetical protein HMPREF1531_00926 [Propionibacterium sp. oral taxon 192 str. F0372]|uniref:hypothetical protein n=1 Tax=Propionibacterium sp. oral taxon 192 TaxID=671222 RepID=UPI0003535C43|nr:hypothetical protein [Propionibacterium sp. oral taxon 192]EPH06276.1 hypothetical protein HMPREF1531_00926 [Propionibacterium sp. oral taxon 192 str. F0372]
MPDPSLGVAVIAAALLAGGVWLVVCGLREAPPALGPALEQLTGQGDDTWESSGPALVIDESSRLENLGALAYQRLRLPLPERTVTMLTLEGRSIGDYFVHKAFLCLAGLMLPSLATLVFSLVIPIGWSLPLVVGLAAGILGWFWPDIALRSSQTRTDSDAREAVSTYFDLVLLERLANQSATGALDAAAGLSDAPVFRHIRSALTQARLEQRPPWRDLHRCAEELSIPAIADIADIMRLEDQGASLADVLSARVAELRDAHLGAEKQEATRTSERMTLWMTIPVIIFALAMLIPPMLRMASG